MLHQLRGRPREALGWFHRVHQAELRADPSAKNRQDAALDTAFMLSSPATARIPEARAHIARTLARIPMASLPETERAWNTLAILAARTRDPALARTAEQGAQALFIPSAPDSVGTRAFFAGHRALAEGRYADALPIFQEVERRYAIHWRYSQVVLSSLFDLTGQADSAIAHLEHYVSMREPIIDFDSDYLALSYKRLGELYEAKGSAADAIKHYESFVGLWKDAEPELQPQVASVRERIKRLRPPG